MISVTPKVDISTFPRLFHTHGESCMLTPCCVSAAGHSARCQWVLRCPCIMSDKRAYSVCQGVAQCTDDRSDQMQRAWNINCLRAHQTEGTQAHWSARDKQLTVSLTCTSVHAHVQHAAVGCCLIIRLLLLTCFNWYYECISNHTYGLSGM